MNISPTVHKTIPRVERTARALGVQVDQFAGWMKHPSIPSFQDDLPETAVPEFGLYGEPFKLYAFFCPAPAGGGNGFPGSSIR